MPEARPRGRPRKFDPDTALSRAVEIFWINGYAGTSLDMLAAATGMNRPSLYAAFGDKKSIYIKALLRFQADLRGRLVAALADRETLADWLSGYLDTSIDMYVSGAAQRGCFAICTALVEAPGDPDIKAELGAALARIDQAVEARLVRARAEGELPASADPAALTRLFAAVIHSIAVRARAGASPDELQVIARQAVAALLPSKGEVQ